MKADRHGEADEDLGFSQLVVFVLVLEGLENEFAAVPRRSIEPGPGLLVQLTRPTTTITKKGKLQQQKKKATKKKKKKNHHSVAVKEGFESLTEAEASAADTNILQ